MTSDVFPNAASRRNISIPPRPLSSSKQEMEILNEILDLLEIFLSISHAGERSELSSVPLALIPT